MCMVNRMQSMSNEELVRLLEDLLETSAPQTKGALPLTSLPDSVATQLKESGGNLHAFIVLDIFLLLLQLLE